MNRLAACTIVGLCISLSACKSADAPPPAPPPPPAPAPAETCVLPTNCLAYAGKITVPRSGIVSPAQQCVVVDTTTQVDWEGATDVKTLRIGWLDKSPDGYCDKPPTAGANCQGKNCDFKPASIPPGTGKFYCLCYETIPTATDGTTTLADPRLIIRR